MNCPFCKQELNFGGFIQSGDIRINTYACWNGSCWPHDFPRYKCSYRCSILEGQENLSTEEYSIDDFYVKVDGRNNSTKISKLVSAILFDEVTVPRALWLNPINLEATLDKLKFCVMFS